ncbi:hypothetical protein CYMTET_52696 [Cymbomonas tetramitiformis]|uniref:Uncharacterized protein n=1 Tax=Cymbomonas tetramitiformis TaxID=36881 RepID=A0AAE0BII5_9CHLO|nr:hypothetical protein CYMTET_52696 [Cymbomonas tetramitiformis]
MLPRLQKWTAFVLLTSSTHQSIPPDPVVHLRSPKHQRRRRPTSCSKNASRLPRRLESRKNNRATLRTKTATLTIPGKQQRELGVAQEGVELDTRPGVTDAATYCKVMDRYCTGTARMRLDRNTSVGALICQQRYYDMLVNERENSAAQFVVETRAADTVIADLERQFNRGLLCSIAPFLKNGTFRCAYVLPKDKEATLQKDRPIQPNNSAPLAPMQNVVGGAIEFLVQEAGHSLMLGGTHRLKAAVITFNERAADAVGVYAFTFDAKDQFFNLDHDLTKQAIRAVILAGCKRAGKSAMTVTVRGAKGVQWRHITLVRQADDALALVYLMEGTAAEWKILRRILRMYRDE